MATEILGQGKRKQNTIETIEPTIFIGLGGTGKEVLLRIRQRFFERFGTKGYPTMAYVWVDTDQQNPLLDGQALDHIAEEVIFQPEEIIDAQVGPGEFLGYFKDHLNHPNIFRWMYQSLGSLGSVQNGARQVRALGRLGFFHAFSKIQQRLSQMESQVLDKSNRDRTENEFGLLVSDALKIVIVTSVAGGTGSGMFLDTAFYCRHRFKADNVGYLLLPSVFAPDIQNNEPMYANAYAALKELEFYSMRKDFINADLETADQMQASSMKIESAHDFDVEWTRNERLSIIGPPFNTCYLIDNQTRRGGRGGGQVSPTKKADLCDMIAESIFVDYTNYGFSARKRSVRSNLEDFLGNELKYEYLSAREDVVHTEIFSCRFSAMGFTKIFVPIDRIRRACSYMLAVDLLGQFLRVNPSSGTLEEEIKRHELDKAGLRSPRDFALLGNVDDAGRTILDVIDSHWKGQIDELASLAWSSDPDLPQTFRKRFEAYRTAKFDEPHDRAEWGEFIRRVKLTNRPALVEAMKSRITSRVRAWLDSPHVRFNMAIDYLLTLATILSKYEDDFRSKFQQRESEARELSDDIRTLEHYIQDEKTGWWVHRRSMDTLVREACSRASDFFKAQALSLTYACAAEVCHDLRAFIGKRESVRLADGTEIEVRQGLVQTVAELRDKLVTMKTSMDHKLDAFEKAEEHLIFENLYKKGMFREYYRLQQSDSKWKVVDLAGDEPQLAQIEREFCEKAEIGGIFDLVARFDDVGPANVEHALTSYTFEKFKALDIKADALKLFEELYKQPGRIRERIERFVGNGTPWLVSSSLAQLGGVVQSNFEEDVILGISGDRKAHDRYQSFVKQVREIARARMEKATLGPEVDVELNSIYFYTEMAGIPLMYIDRLDQYRKAYLERIVTAQKPHHLTRNEDQFLDILPKEQKEIESTIRINSAVMMGTILNILDVTSEGGTPLYSYRDLETVPPKKVPLGSRHMAVETLRHTPDLLSKLDRRTQRVWDELSSNQRKQFFAILSYHVLDGTDTISGRYDSLGKPLRVQEGPFAPRYLSIAGRKVEHFSAEYKAFSRLIAREAQKLADVLNRNVADMNEVWKELYPDLDTFSEEVLIGAARMRRLRSVPDGIGRQRVEPENRSEPYKTVPSGGGI